MITKSLSATGKKHGFGFRIMTGIIAVVFICSASTASFAFQLNSLKTTVTDGENSVSISSKTDNPNEIIKLAGFSLGAYDELDLSGFSEEDGGTISINRAKIVRINDNGKIGYYVGYSDTVGDLFEERGIDIFEGDIPSTAAGDRVFDGMKLMIKRAFSVVITCDGETKRLPLAEGTVADALEKAEITLGKEDTVSPSLDTKLNGFSKIKVTRIERKISTVEEPIDFETDIKYDNDMFAGESEIISEGIKGIKELSFDEKYVDGVLTETVLSGETVIKEPVNQVKAVGTKSRDYLAAYKNNVSPISELDIPKSVKVGADGVPVDYKYKVQAKATAYTGDPETASGRKPMAGHVAVDPNEYPYGTELYVTSADGSYVYGYCVAADTGGFVDMGNADIDLYMNNEDMCDDWGNRAVNIYVLG